CAREMAAQAVFAYW
nr:immunoglobulin heavy chain junction region [Mus musculus]